MKFCTKIDLQNYFWPSNIHLKLLNTGRLKSKKLHEWDNFMVNANIFWNMSVKLIFLYIFCLKTFFDKYTEKMKKIFKFRI